MKDTTWMSEWSGRKTMEQQMDPDSNAREWNGMEWNGLT